MSWLKLVHQSLSELVAYCHPLGYWLHWVLQLIKIMDPGCNIDSLYPVLPLSSLSYTPLDLLCFLFFPLFSLYPPPFYSHFYFVLGLWVLGVSGRSFDPFSSFQLKFPCDGHSLEVWPHSPHCQHLNGFFPLLNGPAEEVAGPPVFFGVFLEGCVLDLGTFTTCHFLGRFNNRC